MRNILFGLVFIGLEVSEVMLLEGQVTEELAHDAWRP